jgi:hypothetical protein
MHFNASWHASGLRWIGSLFNGAAGFLERREAAVRAAAPSHGPRPEDYVDEMRQRLLTRSF